MIFLPETSIDPKIEGFLLNLRDPITEWAHELVGLLRPMLFHELSKPGPLFLYLGCLTQPA